MNDTIQQSNLDDYLSIKNAVSRYPNIWPSEASLRWDIHTRRQEMVHLGILVARGRRIYINTQRIASWFESKAQDAILSGQTRRQDYEGI